MMGLSDGRKSSRIRLAVLIQYRSVTDTQPATQPRCRSTLNALAKASSLKIGLVTRRRHVLKSAIAMEIVAVGVVAPLDTYVVPSISAMQ